MFHTKGTVQFWFHNMKYGFRYRKKATAVHSIDTVLASYCIPEPEVIGMEKVSDITFSQNHFTVAMYNKSIYIDILIKLWLTLKGCTHPMHVQSRYLHRIRTQWTLDRSMVFIEVFFTFWSWYWLIALVTQDDIPSAVNLMHYKVHLSNVSFAKM